VTGVGDHPVRHILRTLARHLAGPAHLRLLGGAALVVGYGLERATEDADLLLDDAELQALVDQADLGTALERANEELEPDGLYLTHIWGPEQQILTPEWRTGCRAVGEEWGSDLLTVSVLGPLDLITSKLCRADEEDLHDISHVVAVERLSLEAVEAALARAVVPDHFAEVFPESCERVLARLGRELD